MAGIAALQQAAMACAKARVVKGGYGSSRSGDHEARTLSSRGAGTLRDERGARTGTTRRRAAPTGSEGNQGGRLPSWAREAVSRGGKDPDEVERTLARAKEESDAMSVGMGILMRDMRRGLPSPVVRERYSSPCNGNVSHRKPIPQERVFFGRGFSIM